MAVVIPSIRGGQVEKFAPGDRITMTVAGTTVVGGRLVEVNGNRTVRPAQAASLKTLGVALYDGAIGDKVTVATEGVWLLRAQGAIAAGDQVIVSAGNDGRVAPLAPAAGALAADINNARAVVGRALEAIADGADGPILLGGK